MKPLGGADVARLVTLAAIWGASFYFFRILAPVLGPVATAAFTLSQGGRGVVIYQALYRGDPQTPEQRARASRGVVFATVRPEQWLVALRDRLPSALGICLIDNNAEPGARVLASVGEHWGLIPLDIEPEAIPRGWPEVLRTETDAEGLLAKDEQVAAEFDARRQQPA